LQTLNSIAKQVNKRPGLSEDSTVGKAVVASASVGATIPLTSIGGKLAAEGRSMDQQRLQSAHDYARGAVESAQLSDATALAKDFRSSDAYQWARSSRVVGTSEFDSSSRDATEHQYAKELAYGRAKELARTAQFMREWSSGAQTDFTNYAARRLSERGLLREDDPIRLQRAISEIAMSYARGGDVAGGFAPGDSALGPAIPVHRSLGWSSPEIRGEFTGRGQGAANEQGNRNDAELRARQAQARVAPSATPSDDVKGKVQKDEQKATSEILNRREKLSRDQGDMSDGYNDALRHDKVSSQHGGNRAVLDTIGIQGDNRPQLGDSPPEATLPKWHFSADGTPTTGDAPATGQPPTESASTTGTPSPTGNKKRSRTGTTGKW